MTGGTTVRPWVVLIVLVICMPADSSSGNTRRHTWTVGDTTYQDEVVIERPKEESMEVAKEIVEVDLELENGAPHLYITTTPSPSRSPLTLEQETKGKLLELVVEEIIEEDDHHESMFQYNNNHNNKHNNKRKHNNRHNNKHDE
eukprot:TRINITY_DN5955_c0_g1_i1.p1 TRINITY_DN5955_c0_g1~~TRINITY_DN5955_c0_g1_i1.p1  ORF type:complete len:144 (-),score=40.94 TRINITY_DN5955_c0_g1_i1:552-983(-)